MCDKLSPEGDSPDRWSRLTDKLKEAEQCNAQLRDVLEFTQLQVAQLTTERDGCRDLIATQRTRIAAAEQENAQLREALHLWRKGDVPGHPFGTLAEARTLTAALFAKPEGE